MILPTDDVASPDGAKAHDAVVIHGILGSRRNWRAFVRRLSPSVPDWTLHTVDLRNHGDAPSAPPPHTLAACAGDLAETAATWDRPPSVVIGHSFGGKVALAYAARRPGELRAVWVLDAVPGSLPQLPIRRDDEDVVRLIEVLGTIPLPVADHRTLEGHLRSQGFGPVLASWMTTNLAPAEGGGFRWRFELAGVRAMLADYAAWDAWSVLEDPPCPIHVVRAGRSDRWTAEDIARLDALQAEGKVSHHVLPDAGHWVHVDAPERLGALIRDGLTASTQR